MLLLVFVISAKTENSNYTKEEDEDKECNQAAFLLSFVESFIALWISAVPISESLVVLVAILFLAVFVAHPLTAAPEEGDHATTSHCLVAVPVTLLFTRSNSIA